MCSAAAVAVSLMGATVATGDDSGGWPTTAPSTRPANLVRVAIYNDAGGKVDEDKSNVAKCLQLDPSYTFQFVAAADPRRR